MASSCPANPRPQIAQGSTALPGQWVGPTQFAPAAGGTKQRCQVSKTHRAHLAAWQPSSLPFSFSHFLFISSSWLSRDGGRAASSYFISCQSWHPPPRRWIRQGGEPAACSTLARWDTQGHRSTVLHSAKTGVGELGRATSACSWDLGGASDWMACCAGRSKPHQRLSPVGSTLTRKRQEIVRKTLSALLGLPRAHVGQTRELGRRTKSFFVGRDGWSKIRRLSWVLIEDQNGHQDGHRTADHGNGHMGSQRTTNLPK